ncbi:unnamed protein product [Rotaria magnacalcarata]|uniref:Uncharacterized protein n=1 Tax=Rotaria magnacalcarata TaxID=392030 RepID=A0A8S3FXN2_9BILA|nr:unnamed protein product [Rotaria magnacalcarata]
MLDYNDILVTETLVMRRWLVQFPRITMKNFSPYTSNGDINGAIFSLPYVWQPIADVIGEEHKKKRETIRRARLDKPESGLHRRQQLEKYFLATLHFAAKCKFENCKKQWMCHMQHKETEVDLLPYRNFAERVAKSTVDFEKFCQEQ